MSDKKPFRFSLQSFNTESPRSWRNLISKTESLGYSTFFLADHVLSPGPALESTFHPVVLVKATAKKIDWIRQGAGQRFEDRETYGISYVAVLDDGENNMVESFAPVVERLAGK